MTNPQDSEEKKGELKNAVIEKVSIDFERFPTYIIHLNYGGGGQGAGCLIFGKNDGNFTRHLRLICKVLESDTWEGLRGKPCRVVADWGKVYKIGHFIKEDWFDISNEYHRELQNRLYKDEDK